jgi:hypothetical protein
MRIVLLTTEILHTDLSARTVALLQELNSTRRQAEVIAALELLLCLAR